jgi:pyruvate dehydrogenase E2 component (dihydrolipoamide acetyltransferase)
MAETITMPKLGFDMAEGTLVRWVKAEGEDVKKGDVIAEIETDKATVEVESTHSGVMARHLVEQGTIVPVSTPIAVVTQPGEKLEEGAVPAGGDGGQAQPAGNGTGANGTGQAVQEAVQKPSEQEMEEKGPAPKPEEALTAAEVTGKPAPTSEQPKTQAVDEAAGKATQTGAGEARPAGKVFATPLARKMAEDRGVDLATLTGTGPNGRIRRRDVEAALERKPAAEPTTQPIGQPERKPEVRPVTFSQVGELNVLPDQEVTLNRLRAAIGRRMTESKQQLPHFYVTYDYNVEALLALRKQVNEFLPDEQKLTVNDFIIKAVALNLRDFPNINASIGAGKIVRHGAVNIGVAVAVEGGLLTIVIKNADLKPLAQISAEAKELVARARSGKVRPDDIEGSTFSISNLGMFDVEHFVAIINPPEAAILSVSAAKQVPVVVDGALKVGTRMKATISADHRVTDGAEAAQFMQSLAQYIEQPMRLML